MLEKPRIFVTRTLACGERLRLKHKIRWIRQSTNWKHSQFLGKHAVAVILSNRWSFLSYYMRNHGFIMIHKGKIFEVYYLLIIAEMKVLTFNLAVDWHTVIYAAFFGQPAKKGMNIAWNYFKHYRIDFTYMHMHKCLYTWCFVLCILFPPLFCLCDFKIYWHILKTVQKKIL